MSCETSSTDDPGLAGTYCQGTRKTSGPTCLSKYSGPGFTKERAIWLPAMVMLQIAITNTDAVARNLRASAIDDATAAKAPDEELDWKL